MEVKKLFALASVTALTGFVATGLTAACSSTEVVTIPADAAAGSSSSSSGTVKRDGGKSTSGGVIEDDDDAVGDDDDTTTEPTCLNTDPIDATKFPYTKSTKGVKNACTSKEVSAFSAWFKAHSGDDDLLDTWSQQVSPTCAECIFSDDTDPKAPAEAWAPMVYVLNEKGEKTFNVNRGGCVEAVSGKFECGQAYQQFQDCRVQACLIDCKTQTEFNKCIQDGNVIKTSCKEALDAIKAECGEKEIGKFETACKGTSYTFEGPIKQLCVNGAGGGTPPVDAGKDANGP